jgi:HK97 family phage major capsid protein
MYAFPFATQSLLDDANIDIEAWLTNKTTGKMSRDETAAFFTGNGVNKPRGVLTYPTAATADGARAWGTFEHVASGAAGAYAAAPAGVERLLDLIHKGKVAYRAGASWWMARATLAETRKLKDTAGNFVWLPAAAQAERGIAGAPPSTLLGYPVVEAEDMPALAANSLSIAFGDMGQTYQIVDRIGFRVIRDPITNKPFVGFYVTRRVGGDCLHFETLKFLKFA